MQPPRYLTNYANHLRAARRRARKFTPLPVQTRSRKIDYVDALNEYFTSLPPANLYRRWMLSEVCILVPGIYCEKSAPRVIAAALRKLGFTEHRDWTKAGRNRRYWLPTHFQR